MGNVQTFVNYNTELTFTSDLNDQIQSCGTIFHPSFGNIQLWKMNNNTSHQLFSFTRHLYFQDSILLTIHSKRSQLQHPNLLQYYACTQNTPQYCENVESQQFYFEYISQTLSQYLYARSEPFKEIEIWKSFEQLVSVLQYLQHNGQSHGKITLDQIFITLNQNLKTLDQITIYSTPQQIKQDVYHLAQVILELMTKKKFHENLQDTLISLSALYSQQLLQLLGRMLNNIPDQRPDFIEISQILQNRQFRSTSKNQEMKLNPTITKFQDNTQNMINVISYKVFNKNLYQKQLSPQKISITLKQFQPQRVVQSIKKEAVSPQIKESFQQLSSGQQSAATYLKESKTISQVSTNSLNASFIDSYRTNQYQRESIQNKLCIHQNKSDLKNRLFKDDLNQTSSSYTPIELLL